MFSGRDQVQWQYFRCGIAWLISPGMLLLYLMPSPSLAKDAAVLMAAAESPTPTLLQPEGIRDSKGQSQAITQPLVSQVCMMMNLSEVEKTLGTPGKLVDDAKDPTYGTTQSYEWKNGNGSYFWATLSQGRIIGMGQLGLPGKALPERALITQKMYEQLKPGMTLAEVEAILEHPGQPGLPFGRSAPDDRQTYHWQVSCKSASVLLIHFKQNKVVEIEMDPLHLLLFR